MENPVSLQLSMASFGFWGRFWRIGAGVLQIGVGGAIVNNHEPN